MKTNLFQSPHETSNNCSAVVVNEAVWDWVGGIGLEWCSVEERSKGVNIDGRVVAVIAGVPTSLTYSLRLDSSWCFEQAILKCESADKKTVLEIRRTFQGWSTNGRVRPDLNGCMDIDIMTSPLTNMLPIRRLPWERGRGYDILTAFIRVPELSVDDLQDPVMLVHKALAEMDDVLEVDEPLLAQCLLVRCCEASHLFVLRPCLSFAI